MPDPIQPFPPDLANELLFSIVTRDPQRMMLDPPSSLQDYRAMLAAELLRRLRLSKDIRHGN